MTSNKDLIRILKNTSILLEIKGENPFKCRAYANAAEIIEAESPDLMNIVLRGENIELRGIGEAISKKISEYFTTGKLGFYSNLLEEFPESLITLTKIAGLGVKKVALLYTNLNIATHEQLEKACLDGSLGELKGFGPKVQENILNSIEHLRASKGRYLQEYASAEAEEILVTLKQINGIIRADLAGDYRRFSEVIEKFVFVASTFIKNEALQNAASAFGAVAECEKLLFATTQSIPVEIIICNDSDYASTLHRETGSTDYHEAVIKLTSDTSATYTDENEIYSRAGLQYVEPELRESPDILIKAKSHSIEQLIGNEELRGMLHVHSLWSDGVNTIRDMALESKSMGFSYIAICDHSRAAAYANGLSIDRVREQHEEIDMINEEDLGIKILKGIESDILPDGSLDYPDDVMESFDIVVASVHSSFKLSRQQQTQRIIYALMSPYTSILGHPTGRLLLTRPPYELDMDEIIQAAADYGKIIEINANPYRLDLSWENVIKAKEKGVKIAINPDSHKTSTLSDIYMGVKVARKGGLGKQDVVNCLEYDDFQKSICH